MTLMLFKPLGSAKTATQLTMNQSQKHPIIWISKRQFKSQGVHEVHEVQTEAGEKAILKFGNPERLKRESICCLLLASHHFPQPLDPKQPLQFFETLSPQSWAPTADSNQPLAILWRPNSGTALSQYPSRGSREKNLEFIWAALEESLACLTVLKQCELSHYDIKPDHIFCFEDENASLRLSLIDLEFAGSSRQPPHSGTPRYLPPEGMAISGRRRDSWAFALSLLEWLLIHEFHSADLPLFSANSLDEQATDEARAAYRSYALPPSFEQLELWLAQVKTLDSALAEAFSLLLKKQWDPSPFDLSDILTSHRSLQQYQTSKRLSSPGEDFQRLRRRYLALRGIARFFHSYPAQEESFPHLLEADRQAFSAVHRVDTQEVQPIHWPELDPAERAQWLAEDRALLLSETESASAVLESLQRLSVNTPRQESYEGLPQWWLLTRGTPSLNSIDISAAITETSDDALLLESAKLCRLKGNYRAARNFLAKIKSNHKRDILHLLYSVELALNQHREQQSEEALLTLQNALAEQELTHRSDSALFRTALGQVQGWTARIFFDLGRKDDCLKILNGAERSPATAEVRALLACLEGKTSEALSLLDSAWSTALHPEEWARLQGMRGYILHAAAQADAASQAYERASEYAYSIGAKLETASYDTGWAASACEAGRLDEAVRAAAFAEQGFAELGRWGQAARACLTRAEASRIGGLERSHRSALKQGRELAQLATDPLCEAYLDLSESDAQLSKKSDEALELARSAMKILSPFGKEQLLRASSRLIASSSKRGTLKQQELDETAQLLGEIDWEPLPNNIKLEWYFSKTYQILSQDLSLLSKDDSKGSHLIIDALIELSSKDLNPAIATKAFHFGALLSQRLGEREKAFRLNLEARRHAALLLSRNPASWRDSLRSNVWWPHESLDAPAGLGLNHDKMSEIENILRQLGTRDSLRTLLEQVLDILLLSTKIERGLLLLPAGDRLQIRAKRNHPDYPETSLELNFARSVAERARREGVAVFAWDALNQLPKELSASVQSLSLRSVVALPIIARGEILAVAYLDDRYDKKTFETQDQPWIQLLTRLAGTAIADSRDQLLLRRSARRAQRAEQKLAKQLEYAEQERDTARTQLRELNRGERNTNDYAGIVGNSEALQKCLRLIDRVAVTTMPVLIRGESGTGKELIAKAIHQHSNRKRGAWVAENCAAVPTNLLEATLFGHVRGAFTGADRARIGLFQMAHEGTLFLDEIGDMPLDMQSKLLRVLQSGEVRPIGSNTSITVDVRVVAATHQPLEQMVREGKFREDLWYRICAFPISIPPLRERPEDILPLFAHFWQLYGSTDRPLRIDSEARKSLESYAFPGNVRELENEVRRCLVLSDGLILAEHLNLGGYEGKQAEESESRSGQLGDWLASLPQATSLRETLDTVEKRLVEETLRLFAGNQSRTAEHLKISRFGLQKMMKRLDIRVESAEITSGSRSR